MRCFLPATKAQTLVHRIPFWNYGFLYVLMFVAWVAMNWPAFQQFWWHADDYTRAIVFDPWFSVGQGRPIEILVPYLMRWDFATQSLWVHQGIRLAQVALHVLTALLLVRLFAELVGFAVATGAVLFFLFWPFHAESVVWVSAFAYPMAAAMSVGALHVLCFGNKVIPRKVLEISPSLILPFGEGTITPPAVIATPPPSGEVGRGQTFSKTFLGFTKSLCRTQVIVVPLLIMGAILTNQAAALAALVAWVIFQGLYVVQHNRLRAGWFIEGTVLLISYVTGTIISRLLILWILHDPGRAALTTSLREKVFFWLELNRQYVASPHYPWPLTMLLMGLPLVVAGLIIGAWWRRRLSLYQFCIAGLLFGLLTLLPYSVVMLTAESSPAWRILYLAPLMAVATWLIGQHLVGTHRRWEVYGSGLALALYLIVVAPMNWVNAADYVTVFREDMAQLQRIEQTATAHQPPLSQVIVATYPSYLRTWELYDVAYMHYDSKKSAFLRDWTIIPFFLHSSPLPIPAESGNPLAQEPMLLQQCVALCWESGQQQPWQLLVMPDEQTLCVCP